MHRILPTRRQRLAFQEMLNAVQATVERLDRLEAALIEIVPDWTMAPVVSAFQAMRGVQFMTAVTMVSETGDLRRFDVPRQLMAFLGLVPSERSTGERGARVASPRRATAARARRWSRRPGPIVILLAWAWRISSGRRYFHPKVRDIAWKAQTRLCARYRRLMAKGKLMGVRDYQLDAAQAAPGRDSQELHPERLGLAVADCHAQHLAPAVGVDVRRDDNRHRDDVVVPAPGFSTHGSGFTSPRTGSGGVEPNIRPVALERARQETLHPLVDVRTQAGDLALADPSIPMARTSSSTERVETPWM